MRGTFRASVAAALAVSVVVCSSAGAAADAPAGAPVLLQPRAGVYDPAAPSRLDAMASSFLIPGWGQMKLGNTGRAQLFFGAELGIWTAFTVFKVQGKLRRESYLEIARVRAGVASPGSAGGEYYRNLGRFESTASYVRDLRRDARAQFPDDLTARDGYVAMHSPPESLQWEWQSEADRQLYKDKRSDSEGAYQKARYMIGAAVLNRLLSAVDAARSAGDASRAEGVSFHVRPDPDSEGPYQLCVSVPMP